MTRPTHTELVRQLSKPGLAILAELQGSDCELLHMALGVCGEAGELADAIKGVTIYRKPKDAAYRINVIEEVGDALFFLQRIAQMHGFALEDAMEANIDKLLKRYEGAVYSNTAAQERKDKA